MRIINGLIITLSNLQKRLRKFLMLPSQERIAMSEKSHRLGLQITPTDWTNHLLTLV